MSIPKVFHQLWKSPETPAKFTQFRESWIKRNPGWTMRLWTDSDLAALVESHYPGLSELYHGYRHPILRADLGRYLVLETFGGVYADLDCECLRPLETLLCDKSFVIGLEPDDHVEDLAERAQGLTQLLCPSFIASTAGHPFWADVRTAALAAASKDDVLDQTGPMMLTKAFEASRAKADVTLATAAQIYPLNRDACWSGRVFDLEFWERSTREAFVAHYWDGGWFRTPSPLTGLPWEYRVQFTQSSSPPPHLPEQPAATRISCITVAASAAELSFAVESYRRQTHPNKELLVVSRDFDADMQEVVRRTGRSDIHVVVAPAAGEGDLCAEGARRALGDVLCQWDAGVLHDPSRLLVQLKLMRDSQSYACSLERGVIWRPADRRMAITARDRLVEGSLMWVRGAVSVEPADGPVSSERIAAHGLRVALFDLPQLVLKVCAGGPGAFEAAWNSASARFEAERCEAVAEELGKRLPIALARPNVHVTEPRPRPASATGEVLILTPMKDTRRHLPRYFELASRLETAGAPLSIAILEGDSQDGTFEALGEQLPAIRERFSRTVLLQRHDGFEIRGPRWAQGIQRERRATIARARNRLIAEALGAAEWALWLDADVVDYPADLFLRLAATGKDIVAAHCVGPNGRTFDYNTFAFDGGSNDDPAHLIDGLFQPPMGVGRKYLDAFADRDLTPVDAVGGTALLVRGQLHRDGLNFPAFSYRGYIETEGLAMMARDMGYECWATPKLRVTHSAG